MSRAPTPEDLAVLREKLATDDATIVMAVLAAGRKAAGTRLCRLEDRADCVKVLTLQGEHAAANLLRNVTDDTYAAIVAQAVGPAVGPLTPKGFVIDLDADALAGRVVRSTPRHPPKDMPAVDLGLLAPTEE